MNYKEIKFQLLLWVLLLFFISTGFILLPLGKKEIQIDPIQNLKEIRLLREIKPNPQVSIFATNFNRPNKIIYDGVGTFYVSDFQSNSVKTINANGQVSNLPLGGTRLNGPAGLALDSHSNLIIADEGNNQIKYQIRDDSFGTIGTGASGHQDGDFKTATFNAPIAMTLDPITNNIYVLEQNNADIRIIDFNKRTVSTFFGPNLWNSPRSKAGNSGFLKLPADIAFDRTGKILFVVDPGTHSVDYFYFADMHDRTFSLHHTLAGDNNPGFRNSGMKNPRGRGDLIPEFNAPTGIALNSKGEIFIGDSRNNLIRKIIITDTGGIITSGINPYGNGRNNTPLPPPPYGTLEAIAPIDPGGSTFFKVMQSTVSTVAGVPGVAGNANMINPFQSTFSAPGGLTFDSQGNLYICDFFNNMIRRITKL